MSATIRSFAKKLGLGGLSGDHLKRKYWTAQSHLLQVAGIEAFSPPVIGPREASPSLPLRDGNPPFLWRTAFLDSVRQASGTDARRQRALAHVVVAADAAVQGPLYSVVDKTEMPPSGNKRDYYTCGGYWWPNPNSLDGLPWINRDGHMYPGRFTEQYDFTRLDDFAEAVKMLGLAYHFTGAGHYAERAAVLIRRWFLDPETSMNPHLKFAQLIPGRNAVSGSGIIETLRFAYVIDAIGLLAPSGALSGADVNAIREWFVQFLRWMMTSDNGLRERQTNNNHGLSYDIQLISYALFTEQQKLAEDIVKAVPKRRIFKQIQPDGSLPEELRRKESFFYVAYGLSFFFDVATLAENVGIDLWTYRTYDGRGIEAALRALLRHAEGGPPWPHSYTRVPREEMYTLALRGAWAYSNPGLDQIADQYAPDLPLLPVDWLVPRHSSRAVVTS